MRKPKQPGSAPHTHGWALGVQGQLMLFLCGITVLTLGLVWGLITYGLQPMYNRNIQKRLERESSVIAGMIDSAGGQISSRDYGSLTLQNETFWSNLKTALENGVMLLTGGPGTGKTTVVRALLHIFSSMGLKIALTAPTGRAAKRLSESTSCEARTIHRLLDSRRC